MADLVNVDLNKLKKSELIDIIIKQKTEKSVSYSVDKGEVIKEQSDVAEIFDNEDFFDSQDNLPTNGECDKPACVKVNLKFTFAKNEMKTLRILVNHMEKRIADQEEIIRLLKLHNMINSDQKDMIKTSHMPSSDKITSYLTESKINKSQVSNTSLEDKNIAIDKTYSQAVKTVPQKHTNIVTADQVSKAIKNAQESTKTQRSSLTQNNANKVKRTKPIIGTNNNLKQIKTIPKLGYLHVYRLAPETTEDILMNCLTETAPDISFSCKKLEKRDNSTASFKVAFPITHCHKVYNSDIWPDGAAVARFKFPRKANFQHVLQSQPSP